MHIDIADQKSKTVPTPKRQDIPVLLTDVGTTPTGEISSAVVTGVNIAGV